MVRERGPNDRNFTKGKIASRIAHLEADVERYITEMVRIDRQEEGEARLGKVEHLSRRYRGPILHRRSQVCPLR